MEKLQLLAMVQAYTGIGIGLMIGLLIAALLEAFWSPAGVPSTAKYVVGSGLWLLVILYLALAGRQGMRFAGTPADGREIEAEPAEEEGLAAQHGSESTVQPAQPSGVGSYRERGASLRRLGRPAHAFEEGAPGPRKGVQVGRPEDHQTGRLDQPDDRVDVVAPEELGIDSAERRVAEGGVRAQVDEAMRPQDAPDLGHDAAGGGRREVLDGIHTENQVEDALAEGKLGTVAADERRDVAGTRVGDRLGRDVETHRPSRERPPADRFEQDTGAAPDVEHAQGAGTGHVRLEEGGHGAAHPARPPVAVLDLAEPVVVGGLEDPWRWLAAHLSPPSAGA